MNEHDELDLFSDAPGTAGPRRRLILEMDGGARGNPGPAGFGAVVRDAATREVLAERADYLGHVTNNVAEYTGLIEGLAAAREIDPEADVEVRADSKLVVEQMSGRWKIKHADMQALARRAHLAFPPERVTYTWVPRAKNKHADRLANEAMDKRGRVVWGPGGAGHATGGAGGEGGASGPEVGVGRDGGAGGAQHSNWGAVGDGGAAGESGTGRDGGAGGAGHTTGGAGSHGGAGGDGGAPGVGSVNDRVAAAHGGTVPSRRPRPSGGRMRFDDAEPVTIVLVRHGETPMTERRAYSGSQAPGPSLTERGRAQAGRAAQVVAAIGTETFTDLYPVSKVLASPLARTMETGRIVADRLGMMVSAAPAFVEADFGQWEGLEPDEIERRFPGALHAWHTAGQRPQDGESLDDIGERIAAGVRDLTERFEGRTVVVCAHVLAISAALGAVLSVGPAQWRRFRVSPGGVFVVRAWADGDGEIVAANLGAE